jgi:hypothetical protein
MEKFTTLLHLTTPQPSTKLLLMGAFARRELAVGVVVHIIANRSRLS